MARERPSRPIALGRRDRGEGRSERAGGQEVVLDPLAVDPVVLEVVGAVRS